MEEHERPFVTTPPFVVLMRMSRDSSSSGQPLAFSAPSCTKNMFYI